MFKTNNFTTDGKTRFQQELESKMRDRNARGKGTNISPRSNPYDGDEIDSDDEFMGQFNLTSKPINKNNIQKVPSKPWQPPTQKPKTQKNDKDLSRSPLETLDNNKISPRTRDTLNNKEKFHSSDYESQSNLMMTMKKPLDKTWQPPSSKSDLFPSAQNRKSLLTSVSEFPEDSPRYSDTKSNSSTPRLNNSFKSTPDSFSNSPQNIPKPMARSRFSNKDETDGISPRPVPRSKNSFDDNRNAISKSRISAPNETQKDSRKPQVNSCNKSRPDLIDGGIKPNKLNHSYLENSDGSSNEFEKKYNKDSFKKSGSPQPRNKSNRDSPHAIDQKYSSDYVSTNDRRKSRNSPSFDKFETRREREIELSEKKDKSRSPSSSRNSPFDKSNIKRNSSPFGANRQQEDGSFRDQYTADRSNNEAMSNYKPSQNNRNSPNLKNQYDRYSPNRKQDTEESSPRYSSSNSINKDRRESPFQKYQSDLSERNERYFRYDENQGETSQRSPSSERPSSSLSQSSRKKRGDDDYRMHDSPSFRKDNRNSPRYSNEEKSNRSSPQTGLPNSDNSKHLSKQIQHSDNRYNYRKDDEFSLEGREKSRSPGKNYDTEPLYSTTKKSRSFHQDENQFVSDKPPKLGKKKIDHTIDKTEEFDNFNEQLEKSSICEDLVEDPTFYKKAEHEERKSKAMKSSNRINEGALDSVEKAQDKNMKYIDHVGRESNGKNIATNTIKPKPKYGREILNAKGGDDLNLSFDKTSDIRDTVFNQWYSDRLKQSKEQLKEKKLTEKKILNETLKEKEIKTMENKTAYNAWMEGKKDFIPTKVIEQKKNEKRERIKQQEQERKREEAKQLYKRWKENKDAYLQHERRKNLRKEEAKKREEEDLKDAKKKDAKDAYKGWKFKKDEIIQTKHQEEKKEITRKRELEKMAQKEREKDAEKLYLRWIQKKENQSRKDYHQTASVEVEERPAWSPASRTIPFGH